MEIEDDCVYYPYGVITLYLDLLLLLLFVPIIILDHYGHHAGMHNLPLTIQIGRATS